MKVNVKNPLFVLAAGVILIAGSAFGTTKAVEQFSATPQAVQFETAEFYVDLQENQNGSFTSVAGSQSEPGTLKIASLEEVCAGNEEVQVNHNYPEEVKVVNNSKGDFPQYVRVVVVKSWIKDGGKDTIADPSLIQINLNDATKADWGEVDSNEEEAIFYYKKPITKGQEVALIDSILLKEGVINRFSKIVEDGEDSYLTISGYDDKQFEIEVRVDAVQAHHAKDAMLGAWGVDAQFDDAGNLIQVDDKTF